MSVKNINSKKAADRIKRLTRGELSKLIVSITYSESNSTENDEEILHRGARAYGKVGDREEKCSEKNKKFGVGNSYSI